jgi:hypothetical protein
MFFFEPEIDVMFHARDVFDFAGGCLGKSLQGKYGEGDCIPLAMVE